MDPVESAALSLVLFMAVGCQTNAPANNAPANGPTQIMPAPTSTAPTGQSPAPPDSLGAETIQLVEGEARTMSLGLTLQVVDTQFETGPPGPPNPNVSTPSIAVSKLTVLVRLGNKSSELHYVQDSPGVASRTTAEWEGYIIDLVSRHHVNERWITELSVRRK